MKKLIISIKSSSQVLDDFKDALNKAKKRKFTSPHYEISFDNKKDFDKFVKNIYILSHIIAFKPKSVYELAKICGMDVSNLNKIILFFEELGAVQIRKKKVNGRNRKVPVVNYDQIQFDLKAA